MEQIVEKERCVGCKACGDICPRKAISFPVDAEGFWYPAISHDVCIDCGMCQRVCPVLNRTAVQNANAQKPETYAAYHTDLAMRRNSTSGGLYPAIAEAFRGGRQADGGMRKPGTSYLSGCAFTRDWMGAEHIIANDHDGFERIMRSKYFQSDTEGIYRRIRDILRNNDNRVLFSGVPCQIQALVSYLEKTNTDMSELYTIEVICRGINTPLAYRAYKKELEKKYGAPVREFRFKDKSHGWLNLGTKVIFENGRIYYRDRDNDPWVNAFIAGDLYMRKSCANCPAKGFPRAADLTIGDFWGYKFNKDEKENGLSVALVNNAKGKQLLDIAGDRLLVRPADFETALTGNPALTDCAPLSEKRACFFTYIKSMDYSAAVWKSLGLSEYARRKRRIKKLLRTAAARIYHAMKR